MVFCFSDWMWQMPLLVLVCSILEGVMFYFFHKFGHPWKGLLSKALEVGCILKL